MQKIKIIFIILAKTYRTSFGTRCDFSSTGYEQCQLISREGIAYNVNQCIDTKVCIFSRNSNSRIANVRLSVCQSITKTSFSELLLWPLSLSTIEPIDHWTYQPLSLSTSGLLLWLLSLLACQSWLWISLLILVFILIRQI